MLRQEQIPRVLGFEIIVFFDITNTLGIVRVYGGSNVYFAMIKESFCQEQRGRTLQAINEILIKYFEKQQKSGYHFYYAASLGFSFFRSHSL